MSSHKGKAKTKSTAKTAGTKKKAVMNSRNPKKPTAISGDTMSNYAMYKKGGKVKIKKYQDAGPVNTSGPRAEQTNNFSEAKNQVKSDVIRLANREKVNSTLTGDKNSAKNWKDVQQAMTKKAGGRVKKYKEGGFPDLTGDGKVTRADVLKGRGVFKKGGLVKAQLGIWKKEKTINEDGSSITNRVSTNPITGNKREVRVERSGDGDKTKTVKISAKKMGGKIKSKKK